MFAKFMALPFVTRRAVIALASFFTMFVSVHLPKNGFSETLLFAAGFTMLWAMGILIPFLKVLFFVLKWRLNYVVRFK
ncbi:MULTISPECIES: hypothetical protein [unclassified Caballeronia]|jgi:hypothetical protein|uniref:hypothetical protein n=1 Tax=unclassified Caballeronia TaxID=2646786 RepID=UPI00285D44FC|nr:MULTISPECIES: hypothetical protein [unclassified Caballeronia]MDR5776891.1 hypothetical protein [Caballeronia sp. LZ002]MDR5798803.1 hypothetical protein [Caballeronia sp. LZ001]MDR5852324.1 hypothetical protein [Caballeronia sp. LZ003]